MSIFVILGLLVCIEAQEPGAVTPVFVQKGGDVFLNVTIPHGTDEDLVTWRFSKTVTLVRFLPGKEPKVSAYYSGRIEVLEKYSVKLKNLQEADRGVYTAVLSGDTEKQITGYKITVQDPVSPVNLTVDSVSNSSVWCNLTVSCRAQDSHINSTFRCDTHTCSQEGGERLQVPPSASVLHVYLSNGSIICNHSNQVSWTKDTIKNVCSRHAGPESVSAGVSVCLLKTAVLSIALIIMVAAVITVHLMEKLKKHK